MHILRSRPPGKGGFCTMFGLPAQPFDDQHLARLAEVMAQAVMHGWSELDSGYVYLGQFIAHDVSKLAPPTQPLVPATELEQLRTPELDLDSVYGYEDSSTAAIDSATGKMALGLTVDRAGMPGTEDDLPRDLLGAPLICDDRNEDNLILAQLHVQFLKLHNFFVDRIAAAAPRSSPQARFEAARRQLILHYQEVVLYDYLERVLDPRVWSHVVLHQRGTLWNPPAQGRASMPVEFAAAAFRFGHPMVRKNYSLNETRAAAIDEILFTSSEGPVRHAPLRNIDRIRWEYFFANEDSRHLNLGRPIRPAADVFLSDDGRSLALRNLLTGKKSSLPSAQSIVQHIQDAHWQLAEDVGLTLLTGKQLSPPAGFADEKDPVPILEKLTIAHDFGHATPLWYYVLAEAYAQHQGNRLGTLGSLIVASVLRSLVTMTRPSIFDRRDRCPTYITATKRPTSSPARFLCMDDLLRALRE